MKDDFSETNLKVFEKYYLINKVGKKKKKKKIIIKKKNLKKMIGIFREDKTEYYQRKVLNANENLDMSRRDYSIKEFKMISESIKKNQSIKRLEFAKTEIELEKLKLLLESIKENKKIEKLNLAENLIFKKETILIAHFLKSNTSLKVLNLPKNVIKEGLPYLSDALKVNSSLEWLNLSNNQISDNDCADFIECFAYNRSIHTLLIMGNFLSDNFAKIFGEILSQKNFSLKSVNISANNFTDKSNHCFLEAMKINKSITSFNISGSKSIDQGF